MDYAYLLVNYFSTLKPIHVFKLGQLRNPILFQNISKNFLLNWKTLTALRSSLEIYWNWRNQIKMGL